MDQAFATAVAVFVTPGPAVTSTTPVRLVTRCSCVGHVAGGLLVAHVHQADADLVARVNHRETVMAAMSVSMVRSGCGEMPVSDRPPVIRRART